MAVAIVTATAVSAQDSDKEDKIVVSTHQADKADGYEGDSANRCGIKFNFRLTGVTKVELESADGLPLAGAATICKDVQGKTAIGDMAHTSTIITYSAGNKSGFIPGKDYYISTLPCDLYGGYRLSIYRDGLVAHYFGVHQKVELGEFISPDDLVESELEFDKPGAPLVEEGRPKMDSKTHNLFVQYRKNPTEANRQALLDQMYVRYDKVVARKKNKLRELEREARTYSIVEHMQGIVDEMVQNRDTRIQQQFLRFIDPRRDENPKDAWMVLRGASAPNAYIGYAPVTNAKYAAFNPRFVYDAGKENYPVVNITIAEAKAYLDAKGIAYVEKTGNTNDEIMTAASSMVGQVDAVFTPTDNVVMAAAAAVSDTLTKGGIPFYTGADSFVTAGAFATCGVNYTELGTYTADMALDVLETGTVPAYHVMDGGIITVNTETAAALGIDYSAFNELAGQVVEVTTAE